MLPSVDFRKIRGHGPLGSQADGFEELACELLETIVGPWPVETRVERFGNPDGGREGRALLPSGETWAWQTKYVFELDSDAFGQIDRSVRRAVTREDALTRYFVIVPYDRPSGDTADRGSAHTRWNTYVTRWEAVAAERGLSVEFTYLGLHELMLALTEPRHAGRLRYWFDTAMFTAGWFAAVADRAVANAGPRYTPELHVDLPIAGVFEALGRTAIFEHRLREHLGALRASRRFAWRAPAAAVDVLAGAIAAAESGLDVLDQIMTAAVAAAQGFAELPDIVSAVDAASRAVEELDLAIHECCLSESGQYFVGDAAILVSAVRRTSEAVTRLQALVRSPAWAAACRRLLIVTGGPGTGKTHLFCDVARARAVDEQPTVILLGEHFDRRPPVAQVVEQLHFEGSVDDLLAALDAAAQASGTPALLMIDALNESDDPRVWVGHLAGLINDVLKHPHLVLAMSCRSDYTEELVPAVVQERGASVVHTGFAEAPDTAMTRFLQAHEIARPSFPMLQQEFTNPLFLKLLCSTLQARGVRQFPRSGVSLTWLYQAYLDAVNARLAAPGRCDYDERDRPVHSAVEAIAGHLAKNQSLSRSEARQICDRLLPNRGWARSLLNGLAREGVLAISSMAGQERVRFAYQRLGETAVAAKLAALPVDELAVVCGELVTDWWRNRNLLDALSVAVSEKRRMELVDLIEDEEVARPHAAGWLLGSLPWRSIESITGRTVELMQAMFDTGGPSARWPILLQLATIPGHRLNGDWLHKLLAGMTLPERDLVWSTVCSDQEMLDYGPVGQLIAWTWSEASNRADDEVRRLAATATSWLLTSSHRGVRDQATKALVNLLEGHPEVLAAVIAGFHDVDDPYVTERLLAVTCGIAQRSSDAAERQTVAAVVAAMTVENDRWPSHLLARDYARRAIHTGLESGWQPPHVHQTIDPPYHSAWPITARTEDEIEALSGPPDYQYGRIRLSLGRMGDFRRYEIDSAVRKFHAVEEASTGDLVARRVFDRVVELGWTPQRFTELDRSRSWEPSAGRVVERIGKKYQWIALFETLGRLADHRQVGGRFRDDPVRRYDDPTDVVYRDIDPTIVVRGTRSTGLSDSPLVWFSPVAAELDHSSGDLDAWLRVTSDLPNPLQLIAVTDPNGRSWLTLEGQYLWLQPQHPDEEALELPRRRVWYQIRSYLLAGSDAAAITAWARIQNWTGRWMPESHEVHGLLLADHPHHSTWRAATADDEYSWRQIKPPAAMSVTTTWYAGTGSSYDQSCPGLHAILPSCALADRLDLRNGNDFNWTNPSITEIAAYAPATHERGPITFVVDRDLIEKRVRSGDLALLWTLIGAKEEVPPDLHPVDDYHWQELSASYIIDIGGVRRINAIAQLQERGPVTVDQLTWSP